MQLKSAAPGEKLPESSTFYLPLTYYSESDDDPAPLRVIAAEAVATGCNRTPDRHSRENRPLKKRIQTGGK